MEWKPALLAAMLGGCTSGKATHTPPTTDAGTSDAAQQPDVGELGNDGDRFVVKVPTYPGNVTEYRLYSMRNAGDPPRVMVASSAPTNRVLFDPYVGDGVHVFYGAYAIVDGQEQLAFSADGTQPARVWSAPLTITTPGVYTGSWRSLDPGQPAVHVAAGVTGVVIESARVSSMGDGIVVDAGAEVQIQNSRGWGLHPMTQDSTNGKFVSGARPGALTVEHSYAEAWLFGVYIDGQLDAAQKKVGVRWNRIRNIQGRKTNADGSYQPLRSTAGGVAHAVQLNAVSTCADAEIAWNEIVQEPSIGFSEDIVNIYQSSGTPSSKIRVHDNVVYGGYATEPGKPAPSSGEGGGAYAGCGIISDGGDPNGSEALNGELDIYGNIVIATTNCGIGIAGGSMVHVHDNRMTSSGVLEDGTIIWANNVGGYVWSQYTSAFHANLFDKNYSSWLEGPGSAHNTGATPNNNSYWFPDNGTNGTVASYDAQTTAPSGITIQTERDEYQLFWTRTRAAAVTVGIGAP